jgi:hypothetical protein
LAQKFKSIFSGGVFQVSSFGQYFFQQAGFGTAPCGQVLGFFVGGGFCVGIVSGWLCRVAEIGFKVFRSSFGQHKFLLVLFRGFGFVRGWLCRFSKSACIFLAKVLVKIKFTLFQQAFRSTYKISSLQ